MEYYHHVSAFPRYISQIHTLCDDILSRQVLSVEKSEIPGTKKEANSSYSEARPGPRGPLERDVDF